MNRSANAEEVLTVLRQQLSFLREKFHVKRIGLFGSFARNEANDKSDIDFLVEFDAPLNIYIANRYALSDYLQATFGRQVDLANPKSLKPVYRETILKQAVYA